MNRLVARCIIKPTLPPDQLIVEISGDCFDAVDVSVEALEHSLSSSGASCSRVRPHGSDANAKKS